MSQTKLQLKDTELSEQVSEHYRKFFDRFQEIDTLPIEQWKTIHVLAFVCKRYEQHYGLRYSFKFNNPAPSRSYEMWQIKRLANMLSSDPTILKRYIDWVFDVKIIERKRRVTSLAFIAHLDLVNQFKFEHLFDPQAKTIGRTDCLPPNIVAICQRSGVDISTYAELAFVRKMPERQQLFIELQAIDFDLSVLDRIV